MERAKRTVQFSLNESERVGGSERILEYVDALPAVGESGKMYVLQSDSRAMKYVYDPGSSVWIAVGLDVCKSLDH